MGLQIEFGEPGAEEYLREQEEAADLMFEPTEPLEKWQKWANLSRIEAVRADKAEVQRDTLLAALEAAPKPWRSGKPFSYWRWWWKVRHVALGRPKTDGWHWNKRQAAIDAVEGE